MSAAKHTPGPWLIRNESDEPLEIAPLSRNGHIPICEVAVGYEGTIEAEQQANARLIAAAPELLEALNQQLGFLNVLAGTVPLTERDTHRRISIQQEELRAVIAKATGEL